MNSPPFRSYLSAIDNYRRMKETIRFSPMKGEEAKLEYELLSHAFKDDRRRFLQVTDSRDLLGLLQETSQEKYVMESEFYDKLPLIYTPEVVERIVRQGDPQLISLIPLMFAPVEEVRRRFDLGLVSASEIQYGYRQDALTIDQLRRIPADENHEEFWKYAIERISDAETIKFIVENKDHNLNLTSTIIDDALIDDQPEKLRYFARKFPEMQKDFGRFIEKRRKTLYAIYKYVAKYGLPDPDLARFLTPTTMDNMLWIEESKEDPLYGQVVALINLAYAPSQSHLDYFDPNQSRFVPIERLAEMYEPGYTVNNQDFQRLANFFVIRNDPWHWKMLLDGSTRRFIKENNEWGGFTSAVHLERYEFLEYMYQHAPPLQLRSLPPTISDDMNNYLIRKDSELSARYPGAKIGYVIDVEYTVEKNLGVGEILSGTLGRPVPFKWPREVSKVAIEFESFHALHWLLSNLEKWDCKIELRDLEVARKSPTLGPLIQSVGL